MDYPYADLDLLIVNEAEANALAGESVPEQAFVRLLEAPTLSFHLGSQESSIDLEIGELQARWSGRGPLLELKGIRTRTGGDGSLRIDDGGGRFRVELVLPARGTS